MIVDYVGGLSVTTRILRRGGRGIGAGERFEGSAEEGGGGVTGPGPL